MVNFRPLLGSALLGSLLVSCTAMGGSEELGDGGGGVEPTFELVAATPRDGFPTAPVTATIALTFNVPIDRSSVADGAISVTPKTFGTITVDGATLTFDPAGDLRPGTTYVFTLSRDLRGTNGRALGVMDAPYGFKTGGTAPPPDTLPLVGPRPR